MNTVVYIQKKLMLIVVVIKPIFEIFRDLIKNILKIVSMRQNWLETIVSWKVKQKDKSVPALQTHAHNAYKVKQWKVVKSMLFWNSRIS